MKVCIVSHGSGRGGAEEVLLETAECLVESNIDVRVLMPGDCGLGEDLKQLGVPFSKLPYWPWMGHESTWERTQVAARNLLCSVPAFLSLRKWNPDIIYSNTMTICFGAILARILRRPHVWHLHELGYEDHGLKFDFGSKFSYRVINSATACIAVSQITVDSFAKYVDPAKLDIITQSVHRNAYWPTTSDRQSAASDVPVKKHRLRCVIVGRLSEGKRQEDAVLAIAALKNKGLDVELLIVGRANPGYIEKLQSLIEQNGVQDRVILVGTVADRRQFVQSADVVLMCSRCEAFGRVTVEGMLAGKPVIAASTGANPELIQDGYNGLLYQVKDVNDLAAKIQYLYENADLAIEIGKNAESRANEIFNKERFKRDITSYLQAVVDTDPRRARRNVTKQLVSSGISRDGVRSAASRNER